jgi:hypothetical protein
MPVFTKVVALPSVRLSRTDLDDLATLLNGESEWLLFSTSDRDIEYSGSSVEDLVAQRAPERLHNLLIVAIKEDRSRISINLVWHLSTCYARSHDEVWVKGKTQQVKDFFKRRRRWYDRIRKTIVIGAAVFAGMMMSSFTDYVTDGEYFMAGVAGVAIAGCILLISPHPKGGLFPLVDVRISEKPHRIDRDLVLTIVAVMTLLATLASAIKAWM